MIATVHRRTPELSPAVALRLAKADRELAKYNYNPAEPRDWHGRWTRDGSTGPENIPSPEIESEEVAEPHASEQRPRVAENESATATDATGLLDGAGGDVTGEPVSLEQTFERMYDDLGPVDFSKEVIQSGDWLGREGKNLSPVELVNAVAEYSFLQDRLSFWLAYDYKPPTAQGNLLSAALTLYQGAVNGGIVRPGHLPESMLAVAGTASLFGEGPPRRRYEKPTFEDAPGEPLQAPDEVERLGPVVNNSDVKIIWGKGIPEQGVPFETYLEGENPELMRLEPGATAFDLFNPVSEKP